jgi:hypothetical protein
MHVVGAVSFFLGSLLRLFASRTQLPNIYAADSYAKSIGVNQPFNVRQDAEYKDISILPSTVVQTTEARCVWQPCLRQTPHRCFGEP